jgi:parvulin-like peptidyl-prolyl isomerase
MDANDYIIKRRMIQKIEFLAQGFADAAASPDEKSVKAYYEANKKDYYVQPSITFTHVFFDATKRGVQAAEAASGKLERLNANGVPFANAPRHGDRFPYHVNYVERTPDFVASHFGPAIARAVFNLKADDRLWRGPYRSPYGIHLVLVSKSLPGRTPPLEEVRARVFDDARRAQARIQLEAAIGEIVESYDVRVAEDVGGGPRIIPAQAMR